MSEPTPSPLPWPGLRPGDAPVPGPAGLVAAAAAATALSRWYLAPPSAEVLAGLDDPELLDSWPVPGEESARGIAALRNHHDAAEVTDDHARLFVGPGKLLAAPYESVHTSDQGLLFEPETLDVRAWYRHYGLSAPRVGKEPDDHIGLELEFVATLATWALDALEADDPSAAGVYAEGIRGFCETHLFTWADTFTALVLAHAQTDFHRGVAHLTDGLMVALPHLLAEAP